MPAGSASALAQSHDGLHWTKLRSSPILEPGGPGSIDENGVGEPAVWRAHGNYWMLYTGRARNEVRRLALARSRTASTGNALRSSWKAHNPGTPRWSATPRCWWKTIGSGSGSAAETSPIRLKTSSGQIGYGELRFKQ